VNLNSIRVVDLSRFARAQKLAYDCVEHVRDTLRTGMTERDACSLMRRWLGEHAVSALFHDPFAWFGDRAAFRGFWADHKFLPSNRSLQEGMTVILDIAPVVDDCASDIGYSFIHRPDAAQQAIHDSLMRALLQLRDLIVQRARERHSFRAIYREADRVIEAAGFVNQHRRYPHRVLGHRVGKLPPNRLNKARWLGFGLQTYFSLNARQWAAKLLPHTVRSPLWNDGPESEHPPFAGLWAVEPHIALPDLSVGAKWEEILLITDEGAWWLDDDVPHCRAAAQQGWWRSPFLPAVEVFKDREGSALVAGLA
jgi:hypothetical protein